ncbi:MAG: TonB-dependent receptor, partial [Alphaproteobacteria bacterium]|nr:TonB-dependent receptor [Alphaproteobacteria bacterium]
LHGSLYEYFQNSALDSRSLLQPAPLPNQLRQNQFGATLGGPIKKDKTFFFMNYEGKRRAESPTYPPDLVTNILAIDQAKAQLGLAPEGCTAGLTTCSPTPITQGQAFGFLQGVLKTANNDFGFARLDHQINTNNRVALRYLIEDGRALGELIGNTLDGGGIGAPSGGRDLFVRDQSLSGTLTSVLTPNLVNSFLGQWAQRHYNFIGMTGQPDFSILNDLELGHNFGIDDQKYESRMEVSDSISWVKGNHLAKFGFDGNYIWDVDNFPGFTPVRSLVPGIACLDAFSEYYKYGATWLATAPPSGLLSTAQTQCPVNSDNGIVFMYAGVPLPTSATACAAPPWCAPTGAPLNTSTWANAFQPSLFSGYSRQINHGYWGGFAQDQWRVTPKLTFNFGLRWDYESGLAAFVKPDYTAWQPRIGLAYSPDSKTVIRAGAGLFSDRQNMSFFFIPNTQKVVAGYLCDNNAPAAITAICSGAGIKPQVMPMVASGNLQATQGYQIFGFPASQGASAMVANIIATGAYSSLTTGGVLPMAGTCFTTGACGRG